MDIICDANGTSGGSRVRQQDHLSANQGRPLPGLPGRNFKRMANSQRVKGKMRYQAVKEILGIKNNS